MVNVQGSDIDGLYLGITSQTGLHGLVHALNKEPVLPALEPAATAVAAAPAVALAAKVSPILILPAVVSYEKVEHIIILKQRGLAL